ncbi:ATP-grasp domain-containing protein [Kitasatospora griseola]|uniref:ATP-grasp domain-containing protein n=1 Tax=Kitasatospora griseola TaxID=2064 RepID=UPI003438A534
MNIVLCKWDESALRSFLARGAGIILIVDKSDRTWEEMPESILERMMRVYEVDTTDSIDELTAVAVDLELSGTTVDRVVTSHEQAQYGAGFLAQRLGLDPAALITITGVRDKRYMKSRVGGAGVRVARFSTIGSRSDATDVDEVADHVGFPMVVKPVNGMGTIATTRVHDRAQLNSLVETFDYTAPGVRSRQLVAEESISGDEYHIDAVWRDGDPWVFSISRFFCPRLALNEGAGINGSYTLAERDYPELYEAALKMHKAANSALGIERGITHLEMFAGSTSEDLIFSEVATRPGGGGVIPIVREKYGPNLYDAWAEETLDGDRSNLAWKQSPYPYVGGLNITPEQSGVISKLPDFDELLQRPNILSLECPRTVGSRITLAHPSVWCLMLVIGTETEEEMIRLAAELKKTVTIEVTPFPESG